MNRRYQCVLRRNLNNNAYAETISWIPEEQALQEFLLLENRDGVWQMWQVIEFYCQKSNRNDYSGQRRVKNV